MYIEFHSSFTVITGDYNNRECLDFKADLESSYCPDKVSFD